MKFTLFPILTIALALNLSSFPAQSQPSPSEGFPTAMTEVLQQLNLSESQKTQLAEIRQQSWDQVQQVLTPAQKTQFQQSIQQGEGFRVAMKSMNLSNDQKNQIRQIVQASRQQVEGVLTPEQKQQLRQNLRHRFWNR